MIYWDNLLIKNNKFVRLVCEVLEIGCNFCFFIFILIGNLKVYCKLDVYFLVYVIFGFGFMLMLMYFFIYVFRLLWFFLDCLYSIFWLLIYWFLGELKSVNGEYIVYSFYFLIVDICIVDFICVKRNLVEFKIWKLNI